MTARRHTAGSLSPEQIAASHRRALAAKYYRYRVCLIGAIVKANHAEREYEQAVADLEEAQRLTQGDTYWGQAWDAEMIDVLRQNRAFNVGYYLEWLIIRRRSVKQYLAAIRESAEIRSQNVPAVIQTSGLAESLDSPKGKFDADPQACETPASSSILHGKWTGYTVKIGITGGVTLCRPSGRAIAWAGHGTHTCVDDLAREWLATYPGATLADRRRKNQEAA